MILRTTIAAVATLAMAGAAAAADKPVAKTAGEYYLQYRAGVANAKTREDLLPYVPEGGREKLMKASDAEFKQGLAMIQAMMGSITDIKVVKETANGKDAYTLDVTGVDETKTKGTGTVEIQKTAAGWKNGKEVWKFGSSTITVN